VSIRPTPADTDRHVWGALSIKPDFDLMQKLIEIFLEESEGIKHVKSCMPSTVFQAITADEMKHMEKDGGNCLGLKAADGTVLVYSFTIRYTAATDAGENGLVEAAGKRIVDRSVALAKEMGLWHPYVYLNYADIGQDVFAGYGKENREKLKKIQRKWDPEGVFGPRLQPGGFKI
jgi:hypothetical protein